MLPKKRKKLKTMQHLNSQFNSVTWTTFVSCHCAEHLVLFMEHHSVGALDVFCILIRVLGRFCPHSRGGWGSMHGGVDMLVVSYEGHTTLTPHRGR